MIVDHHQEYRNSNFPEQERVAPFAMQECCESKVNDAMSSDSQMHHPGCIQHPDLTESTKDASLSSSGEQSSCPSPRILKKFPESPLISNCNSPTSLFKIIMNHVFKTSMQSSQTQRSTQAMDITGDTSLQCEVSKNLNFTDPYLSAPVMELNLSGFCDVETDHLTREEFNQYRMSKSGVYSPSCFEQQDFLFDNLQSKYTLNTNLPQDDMEDCDLNNENPVKFEDVFPELPSEAGTYDASRYFPEKYTTVKGKRRYVCSLCGVEFTRKYTKDRHQALQVCKRAEVKHFLKNVGKGWKCELCPESYFTSKTMARAHCALHESVLRVCPVCNKSFELLTDQSALKHVREHHPEFFTKD